MRLDKGLVIAVEGVQFITASGLRKEEKELQKNRAPDFSTMPRNLGADEAIVTPGVSCPVWNKAGWHVPGILWETVVADHQKLFPCKILD